MGIIVEFWALSAGAAEDGEDIGVLISSLSVNSLAAEEFFNAIAGTELAPLIGDGGDAVRQLRLPLDLQAALLVQIQPWAHSASELLRQAFDVVETAVDEGQWRRGDLKAVIC